MSLIVASGEVINKNALNLSKSKQMYSFPKDQRFRQLKSSKTCQNFYDLPKVLSNRATSLGFGNKYDFTKANKDKTAPYYEMNSDFDAKKPGHQAYTFGISRHFYEKVFCEASTFGDKSVPGPGNYNFVKPLGSDTLKYSLYGKGDTKVLGSKMKVPGPGEYAPVEINPNGRYPLSQMRNATGIIWGHSKAKRFSYMKSPNPGPGQYDAKNLMSGTGSLYCSKFRSSTAKTMGSKTRLVIGGAGATPGPGSYISFSEFGQYESKNARMDDEKMRQSQSLKNLDGN